ncbi:MAG: hypothetical protein ACRCVT_06795 [Leadbetterella sp.]
MKALLFLFTFVLLLNCTKNTSNKSQGNGNKNIWLKGTTEENINKIDKQMRGFDQAMIEVGYRYQELYWAGKDQNWPYAKYQIEKIKWVIELAMERRPQRAPSAKIFLEQAIPYIEESLAKKDSSDFIASFETLTGYCNACHSMEKVPHFTVRTPLDRRSPIRK